MNRRLAIILSAALVLLFAAWVGGALIPSAAQARPAGTEVVMLQCKTGGTSFSVSAYQGSAAAPSKKTDSCPETLSLLLKEGFTIRDIGYNDQESDFAVYTLLR